MPQYPDCRDEDIYLQTIFSMEKFFQIRKADLGKVRTLAGKIKEGLIRINPFVQRGTSRVCPGCREVCCISKHGYYTFEDLVYLHAIGVKPPDLRFGRNDSSPCQFLTPKGCSMERQFRPSGCNWYFCEALFDVMETMPEYHQFDDDLRGIAELWMKMMEEFQEVYGREHP